MHSRKDWSVWQRMIRSAAGRSSCELPEHSRTITKRTTTWVWRISGSAVRRSGFALAYLVLADVHGRRDEYARQLQNLDAYLKLEPDGPVSKQVREVCEVVGRIVFRTKDEK